MPHFTKVIILCALTVVCGMTAYASLAPSTFPTRVTTIHVQKDSSVSALANELYYKHIISSPFLFKIQTWSKGVRAGDYRFTTQQNLFIVASRMIRGEQDQPKVSITIPEGTNVYDMAFIYLTKLSDFNAPLFVSLAQKYEGYLFPDTYYFLANAKPEEIIKTMRNNFTERIKSLEPELKLFNRPLKDVVTMASLVEEEARDTESRRTVAGILWKRLDKNMYLQVDPPFYYITGKPGGFTLNDLKIDSPYNTYIHKGLPQGPISNPGIEALRATLMPLTTAYYFYLTGKDGVMKYARTFAQHVENKNNYLR